MKKIFYFLSLASLTFLAACSFDDYENDGNQRRRMRNIDSSIEREGRRMMRNIKPSESMQAGIPKKTLFETAENDSGDTYDTNDEMVNYNAKFSRAVDEDYDGTYKIGNPYKIFGVSYVPQNYENYEEVGTASWYGPDFHGKPTANGETYNSGDMTAAHRTLPLPSLVRITNLQNGRSAIVRVNDRGPFAKNRVIDVSERAAEVLGFKDSGTTDVKVELLKNDTDEMLARLKIKN